MATDQASKTNSNAVRIKGEKLERATKVAIRVAARKGERVSTSALVDEILEEGLSKREKQLGI
jgi:hypothetical protein